MAGIHSLPPELLIEIFIAAGSNKTKGFTGPRGHTMFPIKSTGIYSLATASKQMYHAFKAHEHHIFTAIAHQLIHQLSDNAWIPELYIPDFTLAVRLACLVRMVSLTNRSTDHDVLVNIITRVNDMDISDILKPSLYRGILDYLLSNEFVLLLDGISCLAGMRLEMWWLKHIPHGFRDNLPMATFWSRYISEWTSHYERIQRIGEYDAVFRALLNRLLSPSDRETEDNSNETLDNAVEARDNAVEARDNAVEARDNAVEARDNEH